MRTLSTRLHYPFLSTLWEHTCDHLFPGRCLVTGKWIPAGMRYKFLSPEAVQRLFFINGPACVTCGYPFHGWVEGPRSCPHCRQLKPIFRQGISALLLREGARQMVYHLKYRQNRAVIRDILSAMEDCPGYLEFAEDAILVPVPLHWKKQWKRGFNQSLLLAEGIAGLVPSAQVWNGLRRPESKISQTMLSREERTRNVRGVFELRKMPPQPEARYIVVDDVFTTGATLNASAYALLLGGIRRIDVMSFAHG